MKDLNIQAHGFASTKDIVWLGAVVVGALLLNAYLQNEMIKELKKQTKIN